MIEENKPTTINIKNETKTSSKLGFFAVVGIILFILFIISFLIDINADLQKCVKIHDCKSLGVSVATKIFVVDYHISNEIDFLKTNTVDVNALSDTIIPERAVRTDLFVNVFFYLLLLIIVIILSYKIGGGGLVGLLSSIFGLAIYLVLSIIVTGLVTHQIYIPFTCFVKLFEYTGVLI
jgi:hypothetical protein